MKYLVRTTEVYRIDTENEAKAFIESQKEQAENQVVSKYSSEYKEKKTKGEVIDSWFRVTIVKDFNDEKEPDYEVTISYEV